MILRPATMIELGQQLARANAQGQRIDRVDLSNLDRLVEHTPEDLTVTVQTGLTLAALDSHLRRRGQWLPVDPPRPETTTIADVLNGSLNGPRRFGFGTIREHLLGLLVVLADGRQIRNGGKVVKNVAGYDLCKLFVGSHGTLGVPVEATFKLLPLPEREVFAARPCPSVREAMDTLHHLLAGPLTPTILDLHNLTAPALTLVIGLAGAQEDVDWQLSQLEPLGFSALATLDYAELLDPAKVTCHSVLPSHLSELLDSFDDIPFLARAGNGIVYAQGGPSPARQGIPVELQQRVKDLYDPKGILPKLPW